MDNKRTSVQLYESTRKDLTKLIAELEAKDGRKRSYDEGILELIKFWTEGHSKK